MRFLLNAIAFGSVMLLAELAVADVIVFTDEATFLAAVENEILESFESFQATNNRNLSTLSTPQFNLGTTGGFGIYDNPNSAGTFATDGSNYLVTLINSPLQFDFQEVKTAFGLNVTDFGDFTTNDQLVLQVSGESITVASAPRADGNQLFIGVLDSGGFSSVSLSAADAIGIDEIYVAAVPEPNTALLFAFFSTTLLIRRRRTSIASCQGCL